MKRKREHGRILSVETRRRGDSLAADVAAGATSITVNDAGDFDEDGGWLFIGAQTVEYIDCDDDTGVITLAETLDAAGEQGDPVAVWSDLYGEVVEYQEAQVELDGEYDNPDPVVAEVAEGVGDLPEGDRGKAGESCTLHRVADDEWEIVSVGGRSRKSRGVLFWQDSYTVTATGAQTFDLTHDPIENSEHLYWRPAGGAGVYQGQSQFSRERRTVSVPDAEGHLKVSDVLTVEYAYRHGIATPAVPPEPTVVSFIGARYSPGGNATLTNMALPAGTPTGALIVMGVCVGSDYGSGSFTCSDARMSKVADINIDAGGSNGVIGQLWIGYASTLADVAFVADPGTGALDVKKIVIATFDGATADAGRIGTVAAGTNLYTAPALAGSGSGAILFAAGKFGIGSGHLDSAAGYSLMTGDQGVYKVAAMGYRLDASIPSSLCTWVSSSSSVKSNTIVIGLV